jgi:hypothetical protein
MGRVLTSIAPHVPEAHGLLASAGYAVDDQQPQYGAA